jgi:hypothetical protein
MTTTQHRITATLVAVLGAVVFSTPALAEETPAPEPTPTATSTPTPDPTSTPTETPAPSTPSTITIDPPVLYLDQSQFEPMFLVMVLHLGLFVTYLILVAARWGRR